MTNLGLAIVGTGAFWLLALWYRESRNRRLFGVLPQDGWDMAAEGLADELTSLPLHHAVPRTNRALLIDVIGANLAIGRGGDQATAQERAKAAADGLARRWQSPSEDPPEVAVPARSWRRTGH